MVGWSYKLVGGGELASKIGGGGLSKIVGDGRLAPQTGGKWKG